MKAVIEGAIRAARDEWRKDVVGPSYEDVLAVDSGGGGTADTLRCARIVEDYIRSAGSTWAAQLSERTGVIKFDPLSDSWAALFVAYVFLNPVGVEQSLNPELHEHVFGSASRLARGAFWRRAGFEPLESIHREHVKRGDVVVLHAGHVALALGRPDHYGEIPTIEGDALGAKPNAPHDYKGVVIRTRFIDDVGCIYRLEPQHFIIR